jgi:hypothetical protein
MSGTIPFTLSSAFRSKPKTCYAETEPFPRTELIDSQFWELPKGHFKGWMPGMQDLSDEPDFTERPKWIPETWPSGFGRWAETYNVSPENAPVNATAHTDAKNSTCPSADTIHNTYKPAKDPMRITNLDLDLLEPLQ